MSDIANKKYQINVQYYCFQSAGIKESGGSFSDNYYLFSYSVTRLIVATQQTFLQVSQSGYTNVIDGHASLQSWRVKIVLSSERFGLVR